MSRQVIFNSTLITLPGAYSRVDASQFEGLVLGGNGTVAILGEADDGPPKVVQVFNGSSGATAIKNLFGSGDLVEAAAILSDPMNDPKIPAGAQQIVVYKTNPSTQATLAKSPHVFTSRKWGNAANSISIAASAGVDTNARVLVISGGVTNPDLSGDTVTETSPELGGGGKFTVLYTGAGSAAALTISATQLAVTVTGASDSITILFADYSTLDKVLGRLNATGVFTAVALVANAASFDPTFLDAVTSVDVKTGAATFYARNFDILDWINNNSALIYDDAAAYTKGQTAPIATFTATPLAGGSRGTSSNTDWQDGFAALEGVRVNQVVPLVSESSTTTTIFDYLVAHCKKMSGTIGRSERQGWYGAAKTKANLIAAANEANSAHVCLVGQKVLHLRVATQANEFLPEWATACMLAGGRAGTTLHEPLTHKFLNCAGVSSDSSWDVADLEGDVTDLVLNGVVVVQPVQGQGFRVVRGVTTYTRTDNDAFDQESIVQIWKSWSYDIRASLENRIVGSGGDLDAIRTLPGVVDKLGAAYRDRKDLTRTRDDQGNVAEAWRNVKVVSTGNQVFVDVDIVPTPPVDFALVTSNLLPASISA